jgi:hypothetical protein
MNEVGEVTKLEDGSVIIHSPDGKDSECVSANAVKAIAEQLHNDCKGIAEPLQSDCKGIAIPTCRPKPLEEKPQYAEIEKLLNRPKYIQQVSAGIFKNINQILDTQKGLPSYIVDDINKKGIKINDAEIRRDFLPLYRLKLKNKTISNQRIINIILTITLSITLVLYFSKNQVANSPIQTEFAAIKTNKDSVMTYEELHIYITEYCKIKRIQIYPYSEQIILQRINEKGINNIEDIKNEIEKRIGELPKR